MNFWELSPDLGLLYLLFFVPLLPILPIGKTVLFFQAFFQTQLWPVTGVRTESRCKSFEIKLPTWSKFYSEQLHTTEFSFYRFHLGGCIN